MKVPFDDMGDASELDRVKVVAVNMIKNGSGFSKHLGAKLAQMNLEEIKEFKKDFSRYWKRFSKMSEE